MLNFDWLTGVSMPVAKMIFLGLFVFLGILVMLIPKSFIYEGVENPRWFHNIKIWALGDLLFIFIVYSIF